MPNFEQTKSNQDSTHLLFEEAFQRLGETVEALEAGSLTLAEATANYEEGMRLVQRCNQLLSETELKVTKLRDDYATPTEFLGSNNEEEE
jgi:exodeoxyribonuclease VII small subunit